MSSGTAPHSVPLGCTVRSVVHGPRCVPLSWTPRSKLDPVLCENPAEPRLRKIAALTSAAGTLFPLERSINERPRHARLEPRRAAESIYRQWIRYRVSGEFVDRCRERVADRLRHAALGV
jgi:hypothetical protein